MAQEAKRIRIQAPQTTIYDLNDDVLRETFAHLSVKELSAVADICSTFRRVAEQGFALQHTKVILYERERETAFKEIGLSELKIGYPHWAPFLRRFGSGITSIGIRTYTTKKHLVLLKSIVKYCSESLKELELSSAEWTNEMILEWQPLMPQLQKLTLRQFKSESDTDASRLLSLCTELRSLTIECRGQIYFNSPVDLPQLKALGLGYIELTKQKITNLRPSLKRLEKLTLDECQFKSGVDASRMLLLCIELHELSLSTTDPQLMDFPVVLPKLKTLDLSWMRADEENAEIAIKRLLVLNPQLEEIALPSFLNRQIIEMIGQYVPDITKMVLAYREGMIDNWKIFKKLKSLDISLISGPPIPEILKKVAEAGILLERLGVRSYRDYLQMKELIQPIVKFKCLRKLDLGFETNKSEFSDLLTIVRQLPDLSSLILGLTDISFARIPEIIKCAPKLQTMTHFKILITKDTIDDALFIRIRDAVLNHEHRPFRLIVGYTTLLVTRKLLKANFHILQLETAE